MRNHPVNRMRVPFAVLAVVVLAGCGRSITSSYTGANGEAPNLQEWVEEVKHRPAPALDPLPVMQPFEQFEYSAQNMRDPFSAVFATSAAAAGPHPDDHPKQVLEQFPLDSLDMVGTIGKGANLVALVMVPDKVTYRVKVGNYMGQSNGRVTGVFEDRIELVELVPDGAGGWLERPATVSLDDE